MQIGLFYASSTGNTESVAEIIARKLESTAKVKRYNIAEGDIEKMQEFTILVMGISTWGEGELQDDWESAFDTLNSLDLSGKTVALFGLGDQEGYGDNFLDAMGILHEKVVALGAKTVGYTPTDDFEFDESKAVLDNGLFCGLALDEDNESNLTEARIDRWLTELKAILA